MLCPSFLLPQQGEFCPAWGVEAQVIRQGGPHEFSMVAKRAHRSLSNGLARVCTQGEDAMNLRNKVRSSGEDAMSRRKNMVLFSLLGVDTVALDNGSCNNFRTAKGTARAPDNA